jgi:ubiquinone/menaquinone biosynthesis C-methylase UbiE
MSTASFLPDPSPSVSPAIPRSVQSHPLTQVVLTFDHHPIAHAAGMAFPDTVVKNTSGLLRGLTRRWRRERRRRKVGRAYDMALEIARVLPRGSRVLDVGCGNGYIAHHLSAMLNSSVVGIDLAESTESPIDYRCFNGTCFPVEAKSFDVVLLCYVLHHAQELDVVLDEVGRVLRAGGRAVIYEDIPETRWDRLVCAIHDRKWRNRTGRCTFHTATEWRMKFQATDFEMVSQRRLSRLRNLTHPVSRNLYVLKLNGG